MKNNRRIAREMKINYYANQVYQLSYAKPILKTLGGTVIVKRWGKILKFKRYLKKIKYVSNDGEIPKIKVISMDPHNLKNVSGILLSNSNANLVCDRTKCKKIFIGHGNGDKKYGGNPKCLLDYDYHFIAGPKQIYKMVDVGINIPEEKLLKTGNLRFDEYYELVEKRDLLLDIYGIEDKTRKNVLYAPTWKWGNGTLRRYGKLFCKMLSNEFNLIIRPHYYDRRYVKQLKSWLRLNKIKHVYFSDVSNIFIRDVMHDFVISDILISDTSSIMYEYLITRKPIIISETEYEDLHNMPEEMYLPAHVDHFREGMDIVELVKKNIEDRNNYEKYNTLLFNCFYFNDGKSTERALMYLDEIYMGVNPE